MLIDLSIMNVDALSFLNENYTGRFDILESVKDIPLNKQMVYILLFNEKAIIVGRGKKNRAKVIFDSLDKFTDHYKATMVRLYNLYENDAKYTRIIIPCKDKKESELIEKDLHKKIGGEGIFLTNKIKLELFSDLDDNSMENMLIKMILISSYNGISDLRNWRKCDLLTQEVWNKISKKFRIEQDVDEEKKLNVNKNLFR